MLFLFEVHLKPGYTAEQYAEGWVKASRIIQELPGALGTRLHRKLDEPDVLLAIASWDSKASRDAMEADEPEAARKIIADQAPFVDIKVIGDFEDAEWVVPAG
jgi:heme-degrading monooxygenase HmoA